MPNDSNVSAAGYSEAQQDRALSRLVADMQNLSPDDAARFLRDRQRQTLRLVTDHVERALAVSRAGWAQDPPALRIAGGEN